MLRRFLIIWAVLVGLAVPAAAQQRTVVANGASLPPNCSPGQIFFRTATVVSLYQCIDTDTWQVVGGGSGTVTTSSPLSGDGAAMTPVTLPTNADVTLASLTSPLLLGPINFGTSTTNVDPANWFTMSLPINYTATGLYQTAVLDSIGTDPEGYVYGWNFHSIVATQADLTHNEIYAGTFESDVSGDGAITDVVGHGSFGVLGRAGHSDTVTAGRVIGTYTGTNINGPVHSDASIGVYSYFNGNGNGSATDATLFYGEARLVSGSPTVTNLYGVWMNDFATLAASNPYYSWFNSRGVRRVKEDAAFDSVGQAIEALYNPQFTKYTPGATDFERVVLGQWNGNVAEIGTESGGTGTLRNLKLIGAGLSVPALAAPSGQHCTIRVDDTGLLSTTGCS